MRDVPGEFFRSRSLLSCSREETCTPKPQLAETGSVIWWADQQEAALAHKRLEVHTPSLTVRGQQTESSDRPARPCTTLLSSSQTKPNPPIKPLPSLYDSKPKSIQLARCTHTQLFTVPHPPASAETPPFSGNSAPQDRTNAVSRSPTTAARHNAPLPLPPPYAACNATQRPAGGPRQVLPAARRLGSVTAPPLLAPCLLPSAPHLHRVGGRRLGLRNFDRIS